MINSNPKSGKFTKSWMTIFLIWTEANLEYFLDAYFYVHRTINYIVRSLLWIWVSNGFKLIMQPADFLNEESV